jgi:hypothetical protein
MKKLIISISLLVVIFGCDQKVINCSTVCIADGISTTATQCGDTLIADRTCKEPEFVKPEEGIDCVVVTANETKKPEKVTILYLDKQADGFWISGELTDWDLGSGVVGVIEDGEGHERFARNVGP